MNMISVIMQAEISTSILVMLIASHLTEKKIKTNRTNTVIENITALYLRGRQPNRASLHADAKQSLFHVDVHN